MGIKQDAGKLLALIYDWKIQKNKGDIGSKDVLELTKWEPERINNAFDYLNERQDINAVVTMGTYMGVQNFTVTAIFPKAIGIIEDENKFKRYFEVSLGFPQILSVTWGVSEK